MSHLRRSVAAALLVLVAACSDDALPTAPSPVTQPAVEASAVTDVVGFLKGLAIERNESLRSRQFSSAVIGPLGGVLRLNKAGLIVTFPIGALSTPTLVSVEARAGKRVAYTFGPHGLTFTTPIILSQNLRNTSANDNPLVLATLSGAYTPFDVASIEDDGFGLFSQLFSLQLTGVPWSSQYPLTGIFTTTHFSGYALASGFMSVDDGLTLSTQR